MAEFTFTLDPPSSAIPSDGVGVGSNPLGAGEAQPALDLLTHRIIHIGLTSAVVVDSNYYDTSNYEVVVEDTLSPIRVLEVLSTTEKATTRILLLTDYMTPGVTYSVSMSGVLDRNGLPWFAIGNFTARVTKADSMIRSFPQHFDKGADSLLSNILLAIATQDELIGGSRWDTFQPTLVQAAGLLVTDEGDNLVDDDGDSLIIG